MDPEIDSLVADATDRWNAALSPMGVSLGDDSSPPPPPVSAPPVRDDWYTPGNLGPAPAPSSPVVDATQPEAWNPDVQPNHDNSDPLSNGGVSWSVAARDALPAPADGSDRIASTPARLLPQSTIQAAQSSWDQSQADAAATNAAAAQAQQDGDTRSQLGNDEFNDFLQESTPSASSAPSAPSWRLTPDEQAQQLQLYNDLVGQSSAPQDELDRRYQAQDTQSSPVDYISRFPGASQVGGLFDWFGSRAQDANQLARNIPGVAGAADWLGSHVGQGEWGGLDLQPGELGSATGTDQVAPTHIDIPRIGIAPGLEWLADNVANPVAGSTLYGLSEAGREGMRAVTGDATNYPDVPLPDNWANMSPADRWQAMGRWWSERQYLDQIPEAARPAAAVLGLTADFTNPAYDIGAPLRVAGLVRRGSAAIEHEVAAARAAEAADQVVPRSPLANTPIIGQLFEPANVDQLTAADAGWRDAQAARLADEAQAADQLYGPVRTAEQQALDQAGIPRFTADGTELSDAERQAIADAGQTGGAPNLDIPTFQRRAAGGAAQATDAGDMLDRGNLDQPAFLRRGGSMPAPLADTEGPIGPLASIGQHTPQEAIDRAANLVDEHTQTYRWDLDPQTGEPVLRPQPLNGGESLWERTAPEAQPSALDAATAQASTMTPAVGGDAASQWVPNVTDRTSVMQAATDLDRAEAVIQSQLSKIRDATEEQASLARSPQEADLARATGAQQLVEASRAGADAVSQATDALEAAAQRSGVPIPPRLADNYREAAQTIQQAWPQIVKAERDWWAAARASGKPLADDWRKSFYDAKRPIFREMNQQLEKLRQERIQLWGDYRAGAASPAAEASSRAARASVGADATKTSSAATRGVARAGAKQDVAAAAAPTRSLEDIKADIARVQRQLAHQNSQASGDASRAGNMAGEATRSRARQARDASLQRLNALQDELAAARGKSVAPEAAAARAEMTSANEAAQAFGINGAIRANYPSDVLKDLGQAEKFGDFTISPDTYRFLTHRGVTPEGMAPAEALRTAARLIREDSERGMHNVLSRSPELTREGDAAARAAGLPDVATTRRIAQQATPDLIEAARKGKIGYSPNVSPETKAILQRAVKAMDARDPHWWERPAAGRPGHEAVPLPADLVVSKMAYAAADVAARDAGYASKEAWVAAKPSAAQRVVKLYDAVQRVATEHWLATPGFLKHVTLSMGTLAALHDVNPLGVNAARLQRLLPQLRDANILEHGAASSIWGETAAKGSQTRAVYQKLERALGPAGKALKPLEAAHGGYVEAIPHLTHAYEQRIKAAAFLKYFPEATRTALRDTPEAEQALFRAARAEPGVPANVARSITSYLHGAEGPNSIKAIFDDARRLTDPKNAEALNRWEARANQDLHAMTPEARQALADAQRIGTKAAAGRISDWMVNRSNPTRLDQAMKRVFPFWMYDRQNPVIWARTAAENPLLLSGAQTYLDQTGQANASENRPSRLFGYTKLDTFPVLGGVAHALGMGGAGDFLNPLRGLGFWKYVNPQWKDGDTAGQSLGDKLLSLYGNAETAGLSPGLLPTIALNWLSRQLGGHPQDRDIFPQSTWARYLGATGLFNHPGIDIEAPLKNLLYGTSHDANYDYEVQKELLAQLLRGEKPDLMAAHNEAGKHLLLGSLFAMTKHESPEEQQYLDLAKERRDLKASGGDVKAFDKAHPELFPWFDKQYGSTPDDLLRKLDYDQARNQIFATKTGADRDAALKALDQQYTDVAQGRAKAGEQSATTGQAAGSSSASAAGKPLTDKQYVATLFTQRDQIPEDDKVGRARWLMDHAQELRDHGFDKLPDDATLKKSYWATVAKEAGAHGDKDALSEAVAQLAALQGKEPPKVVLTDAERARSDQLRAELDSLTTAKEKAQWFDAHRDELKALGWNVQDRAPSTPTATSRGGSTRGGSSTRRPFTPYRRGPARGYSGGFARGPSRGPSRGGYTPHVTAPQTADRQSWANHWNQISNLSGDDKTRYLLQHWDEINGLAERLGKQPLQGTQAQLEARLRQSDNSKPQGVPADMQGQVAWLGKQQGRIDSLNQVKDAAVAAQSGDEHAINQLGALVDQHRRLFGEDLEGQTPDQIGNRLMLAQGDANQLKRYWQTNGNGPAEARQHIFDQYNQLKSTDRLAAAKYLDQHWDELLSLGYQPKFPRPDITALEARNAGGSTGTSSGYPGGTSGTSFSNPQAGSARSSEAAFWQQYSDLKASDQRAANALLDANRDQLNAWRAAQGKPPIQPRTFNTSGPQTNPTVTAATVSVPGYAASVRNVPSTAKAALFDAAGIPPEQRNGYRVDHIIPLSLGGTNNGSNLQVQPVADAAQKDVVEAYLHDQVRAGQMPLADAQQRIAQDWRGIYNSIPHGTRTRIAARLAQASGQPDVEASGAAAQTAQTAQTARPARQLPWMPAPQGAYSSRAPLTPRAPRPAFTPRPAPLQTPHVSVGRPQPMHSWMPKPAHTYVVPTERRPRGPVRGG